MTQRVTKCWEECQSWTDEERAELADQLIQSLDANVDIHAAWDAEIAERIQELENGTLQCIPSEVVHQNLRNIIDGNRVSSPRSA